MVLLDEIGDDLLERNPWSLQGGDVHPVGANRGELSHEARWHGLRSKRALIWSLATFGCRVWVRRDLAMSKRHMTFVSYHHANDQARKQIFDLRFGNAFEILERGSVDLGDIDPNLQTETIRQKIRDEYLRDCSVTVVLVGTQTWQRKHVDWEIGATLRDTKRNPRGGLLGIILPSYRSTYPHALTFRRDGSIATYDPYTIPPRLHDNVESGYAMLHPWSEDPAEVQDWIHAAYLRKDKVLPTNARVAYGKNRTGDHWS